MKSDELIHFPTFCQYLIIIKYIGAIILILLSHFRSLYMYISCYPYPGLLSLPL